VKAAIDVGLAGIGIEDTTADPDHPIRDFDEAVARVRAAAEAGKGRIVVTGRADNYLQGRPDLDDTVRRLTAFAEVGADVVFAPFPPDVQALGAIVSAVAPTPVNVLISPADQVLTVGELRAVGVKRISLGPSLYAHAMGALEEATASLLRGDIARATTGMDFGRMNRLVERIPD